MPGRALAQAANEQTPPRILLDQSPRAIEYQLGRLTNTELAQVERRPDDPRYRLVYFALLTRKGLGREYFDEGLAALTKMDRVGPTQVLLEALSKVRQDDTETAEKLVRYLLSQPADRLAKDRELFAKAVAGGAAPFVLRGAYTAMMVADGRSEQAWQAAAKQDGHLLELLRGVPALPTGPGTQAVRDQLYAPIAALLADSQDRELRTAALSALGSTRADQQTFRLLAQEIQKTTDADSREAAIGSLQLLPKSAWPTGEVEPLARSLLQLLQGTAPDARTTPAMIEATQLVEKLAEGLDAENGRALRRDLRALGVRVIRIEAVPEQMAFDVKWFVVEAGKPVQIVLSNPDAMSHNLVVSKPGSLKEVGTAATTMTLPSDPKAKPYVPESPLVLHATRLLNWGESERLGFDAPTVPGEYVFVCTFPGHWARMYGVMLVVASLEAWEANPTTPTDPMTGQPFAAQRQ